MISALDPELFKAAFVAWVEGLRDAEPDIVAIDGKTSRRSHDRAKGRAPLHLVSARASRQRLVPGQEATAEKSNEITAIPLLLERLALTGALVTLDAVGATPKIARTVLARGADDLLALKTSQGHLFEEAEFYFGDAAHLQPFQTVDADHGRFETRRHLVSPDVGWLRADRAAPGEPRFPGLKAIARVEAEVEAGGRTSPGAAIRPLPGAPGRPDPRPRRARPLGCGEPPALGARRRLPRRPRPPENRPWPPKHGRRQTHGHEPAQQDRQDRQPQNPP